MLLKCKGAEGRRFESCLPDHIFNSLPVSDQGRQRMLQVFYTLAV